MDTCSFSKSQWLYEGQLVLDLHIENEELPQVELYDCTILNAKLSGAILQRWVFENCVFKDSDLSNLHFENCIFEECLFEDSRLIGTQWKQSSERHLQLKFNRCDLSLANLNGLNLQKVSFTSSNCREVDFSHSKLMESHFLDTHVHQAVFEGADLSLAHLSGAIGEQFDLSTTTLAHATISMNTAVRLIEQMGLKVDTTSLHIRDAD